MRIPIHSTLSENEGSRSKHAELALAHTREPFAFVEVDQSKRIRRITWRNRRGDETGRDHAGQVFLE